MENGSEISRDVFLTEQDVQNLANGVACETWRLHKNDAKNIHLWAQRNRDSWFYYQQTTEDHVNGALTGENMPFTLGIQTPWQREMMLKHSHKEGEGFQLMQPSVLT